MENSNFVSAAFIIAHISPATGKCLLHTFKCDDAQSEMSESTSEVVELHDIAAKDMEVIIRFIYGVLDALPGEQLQSLLLASDRLQVYAVTR